MKKLLILPFLFAAGTSYGCDYTTTNGGYANCLNDVMLDTPQLPAEDTQKLQVFQPDLSVEVQGKIRINQGDTKVIIK
ncbi:MAG: hypothetical protein ACK5MJ_07115 [Alphaproteobacteria bacterium]